MTQNQYSSQSAIFEAILMCILIGLTVVIHYLPVDATEFKHVNNSNDQQITSTNQTVNDHQSKEIIISRWKFLNKISK